MFRFTENVIMQLTKDCNLHCAYCYQGGKASWKGKQIDFETFKQLVDTIIYYRCVLGSVENPIDFHFHGGEVTLIPFETIQKMMEYLLSRKDFFPGISMCMQTNGINLTEEQCEYYHKINMTPGISFDGFHTDDRMSIESTKKLINKLKNIHEKTGCNFGVLSVLSNKNIKTWFEDMQTIRSWAPEVGINIIASEDLSLIPSAEDQWKYWMEPVLKSYLTDNPFIERNVNIAIEKELESIIFEENKAASIKTGCFDRLCGHGANMIAVDPNLIAYNCDKYLEEGPYINLRKGVPINQRDFLGLQQVKRCIHYYHEIFNLERKFHCDECKATEICPGECQAVMYSQYGEYRFNKDMCPIYRRAYDFIYDNWMTIAKREFRCFGQVYRIRPDILKKLDEVGKTIYFDQNRNTYKVVDK